MKIKIIAILLVFICGGMQVNATDYKSLLSKKGIGIVYDNRVDTSFPNWFKPSYSQDINYWLAVLPHEMDKKESQYIVLPSLGVIAPIQDPGAGITPNNFNYNSYLKSGVALYPSTGGSLGSYGNSVIFGHSSDWKYKSGRYKTIFGVLPLLNKGDEIWLYKKKLGIFKLYKYKVLQSYETSAYDSFVLKQSTRKIITLFTCTDIGTARNRWLIKAEQFSGDSYTPYNHNRVVQASLTKKSQIARPQFAIPKVVKQKQQTKIAEPSYTPSSSPSSYSINQSILDSIFY